MSQYLYIITGTTNGIGKELAKILIKNKFSVLGISRSKQKIFDKNYYHIKHDFLNKMNHKKIIKYTNGKTIILILNAATIIKSNKKNFLKSYSANFTNQIDLVKFLNKKSKRTYLVSSMHIFNNINTTPDIGYYVAKKNFYYLVKNEFFANYYKLYCIFFGNVKTNIKSKNSSILVKIPLFGELIERLSINSPKKIANKIFYSTLSHSNNRIINLSILPIIIIKIIMNLINFLCYFKKIR